MKRVTRFTVIVSEDDAGVIPDLQSFGKVLAVANFGLQGPEKDMPDTDFKRLIVEPTVEALKILVRKAIKAEPI